MDWLRDCDNHLCTWFSVRFVNFVYFFYFDLTYLPLVYLNHSYRYAFTIFFFIFHRTEPHFVYLYFVYTDYFVHSDNVFLIILVVFFIPFVSLIIIDKYFYVRVILIFFNIRNYVLFLFIIRLSFEYGIIWPCHVFNMVKCMIICAGLVIT